MGKKITFNDTYLAKWIAREISDHQLQEIVSEKDFIEYKKLQSGIEIFDYLEAPLNNTLAQVNEKISQKQRFTKNNANVRSLFTKGILAIAASIALFFSIQLFNNQRDIIFESGFGEQKMVALLDQSEVLLNAKSSLKYSKKEWKNNRNVSLEGEAFFKVKKGSTFNVVTKNGIISVLGTQFNVNTQENYFEVICYEGKVKVLYHSIEYILTPSKSIRVLNNIITQEDVNISTNKPTWTLGESDFRSVPLKVVIAAIEKQFNVVIKDDSIDNEIIFTGSFDNKNLAVALAAVFKTVHISYQIENNIITLSH